MILPCRTLQEVVNKYGADLVVPDVFKPSYQNNLTFFFNKIQFESPARQHHEKCI